MAEINIDVKLMVDSLQRASRDAQKSLRNIQKTAKDTNSSIQKSTKQSTAAWETFKGVLGANIVAGAFRTIGSAAVDLSKNFVSAASQVEDITAQFTSLTGGLDNAQTLLRDITKFADSTPFELPGLASASRTLLSYGSTQSEIIDQLKVLGDVAAVTGKEVDTIARVFGQVASAGKLTGERLNQFQEAGIPVIRVLAEEMGVAESAITGLVSQGKVDFETFEKAFNRLNKAGGFAFGGLENLAETLSGRLSTLRGAFFNLSAQIGQAVLPVLKTAAEGLTELIQNNKELIAEFSADVFRGVVSGFSLLADSVKLSIGFIASLERQVRALEPVLDGLLAVVKLAAASFLSLASTVQGTFADIIGSTNLFATSVRDAFSQAGQVVLFFAQELVDLAAEIPVKLGEIFGFEVEKPQIFEDISSGIADISLAIQNGSGPLETYADGLRKASEISQGLADSLLESAVDNVSGVFDAVGESADSASSSVEKLASAIKGVPTPGSGTFSNVPTGVGPDEFDIPPTTFDRIVEGLDDLGTQFSKNLNKLPGAIGSVLGAGSGAAAASKAITEGGSALAGSFLGPAAGAIAGPLLGILQQGPEATREFVEGFVESAPLLIEAIIDSLPVLIETIIANLPRLVAALAKAILDPSFTISIAMAFVNGIGEAIASLAPDIQNIGEAITGFISEAGKVLHNIFKGLLDVAKNVFSGFGTFFGDLAKDISQFAKKNIEIYKDFITKTATFIKDSAQFLGKAILKPLEALNRLATKIREGFVDLGEKVLDVLAKPLQSLSRTLTGVFNQVGTIGQKFVDVLLAPFDVLKKVVDSLKDSIEALNPAKALGGGGGGGGFIGKAKSVLGLASGGIVTGTGTRDSVPALLTPGELVVDRTTGPRLNRFLDSMEGGGIGGGESLTLLSQIAESLQNPQAAQVQLVVDGNVLADQILDLSRNNARLTR